MRAQCLIPDGMGHPLWVQASRWLPACSRLTLSWRGHDWAPPEPGPSGLGIPRVVQDAILILGVASFLAAPSRTDGSIGCPKIHPRLLVAGFSLRLRPVTRKLHQHLFLFSPLARRSQATCHAFVNTRRSMRRSSILLRWFPAPS